MTDDAIGAVKVVTTGAATAAGIATWLGAVLPPVILVLTWFTLTCASIAWVYRFWKWFRANAS